MNTRLLTTVALMIGATTASAQGLSPHPAPQELPLSLSDQDWLVTGDNMQAIPTGGIGIGSPASSNIKMAVKDEDPTRQVVGSFLKQSDASQVGGTIGLRGIANGHPGGGVGLAGQASSDEPSATSTGVSALALGSGNATFGIQAQSSGTPLSLSAAIQAVAAALTTDVQYGVQAVSGLSPYYTRINMGTRSIGYGNDMAACGSNYGMHATANPGLETGTNVGVHAVAQRPPSGIAGNPAVNYGVYAYADNDGVINRAAYLNGDVEITGATLTPSDSMLTYDVQTSERGALELIRRLSPRTFMFQQGVAELSLPGAPQCGFLAQELEQVFPQLVHESTRPIVVNEDGVEVASRYRYKSVNQIGLIPFLTQAIQEQQQQIDLLRAENLELKNMRREIDELRRAITP